MWFVRDQYVLILIEHVLCKRNAFFVLQLAIIKDTSSNSIRCVCVYLSSSFVYHLSFRHSSGPRLRVYVRVSFPEKFHDSFPSTRWKPLAARTDSLDDRKVQTSSLRAMQHSLPTLNYRRPQRMNSRSLNCSLSHQKKQ